MKSNTSGSFFLKIAAVNFPPYTTLHDVEMGGIDVGGSFGNIQDELRRRIGLNYVIVTPQSGGFGNVLPNGSATGMAKMIFTKEAELILGPYSLSYTRFKVVDYLPVLVDDPLTLMSASGESQETVDFTNTVRRVDLMYPPYTTLHEVEGGGFDVGGSFRNLQEQLERRLGLNFVIVTPNSGGFGNVLSNGSATGMAKMIVTKEAELILTPYSLSYKRFQAVDYLAVLVDDPLTLISASEESQETVDFTNTVRRVGLMIWICYLIGLGINSFLYAVDDAFRNSKRRMFFNKISYGWEFLRIFINQGSSNFLRSSTTLQKRILFSCFALSTFFFNTYFGGDLHTEAVISTEINIDSLQDFVEESKICLIWEKGTFTEALLMSGNGIIYERIHERVRSCHLSAILGKDMQTESTYRKIISRDFALLGAENFLLVTGQKMCQNHPNAKLHTAKEPMFVSQKALAVGKDMNPEVKKAITEVIERIISSGLMLKWMNDEIGLLPECFRSSPSNTETDLSMGNMETLKKMFCVWIAGTIISICIFIAEILIYTLVSRGKRMQSVGV